ncbi:hypothetical protein DMH26_14880 [Streptomyces sp. WAC 05379]|nr:hypothetical protein DMH26_14880 [Streptomyces sp. WAC 05379]
MKTASRSFGFLTSTVAYGSSRLEQLMSTAVPSFKGLVVSLEGDAVGVGLWVGCERCVSPLRPPALVPESCASLRDELESLRLP